MVYTGGRNLANRKLTLFGGTGNLAINTTTDAGFKLDVNGTARVQGDTTITKTGSALNVQFISQTAQNNFFNVLNGTDGLSFTSRGSGTTGNMGLPANSAEILSFQKAALGIILHSTAYLAIGAHTGERMRLIASTGNLLINTTTDAGYKLDVNGTARVNGNLTVGNTAAGVGKIIVPRSPSLGAYTQLETSDGTPLIRSVSNDTFYFGSSTIAGIIANSQLVLSHGNFIQGNSAQGGASPFSFRYLLDINSYGGSASTPARGFWLYGNIALQSNGFVNLFEISPSVSFDSSSGRILKGIYYNPTITGFDSGETHYAWHSTSGRFKIEGLPTSPTGLTAGELWNNGGVINIV
jgi:hypothetical protein